MTNLGEGKVAYDYLLKNSERSLLPTEKVPDGSTAYIIDSKVLLMFYDGQWYEM